MRDFTQGGIFRQVVAFSMPLIAANFLQSFYSILNMVFVGRMVGHEGVAAIASSMQLIMLFPSFLIGLSVATSVLISQAYGRKNRALMEKILSNSFLATMAFCVLLCGTGIAFNQKFLEWINIPEPKARPDAVTDAGRKEGPRAPAWATPWTSDTGGIGRVVMAWRPSVKVAVKMEELANDGRYRIRQMASDYLNIYLGGMIFIFFFNWIFGMLRGLGDSRTPLFMLIAVTVLDVVLVPLCIGGFGPVPAMGVAGAALGTVLALVIAGFGGYFYIAKKYPEFNIRNWDFHIDWDIIRGVFTIGVPASLQMIVVSLSAVMIVSIVNSFGVEASAAYGIGVQFDQLAFLPAMTIGQAISSMAGQNLGAKKYDRISRILLYSLALSTGISLLFGMLVFFFPGAVGTLFLNAQSETPETVARVLDALSGYFRINCFTYLTFAVIFALQGVVRAAGDTMVMLVFSFLSVIIVRIPLANWLAYGTPLGRNGIWLSMLLSTFAAIILNYAYYASGRWKRVRLLHGPQGPVEEAAEPVGTSPG